MVGVQLHGARPDETAETAAYGLETSARTFDLQALRWRRLDPRRHRDFPGLGTVIQAVSTGQRRFAQRVRFPPNRGNQLLARHEWLEWLAGRRDIG